MVIFGFIDGITNPREDKNNILAICTESLFQVVTEEILRQNFIMDFFFVIRLTTYVLYISPSCLSSPDFPVSLTGLPIRYTFIQRERERARARDLGTKNGGRCKMGKQRMRL